LSAADDVILAASGIERTYRHGDIALPVLYDLDLEVRRGEWVACTGRSGSGKSTGNLDLAATAQVLDLLDALHAQGRTIVMITHEEDVADHADRRLVLRDGALHDETPPVPRLKGEADS
jgi:ABC-type lipoprotein export system ATPase subunit